MYATKRRQRNFKNDCSTLRTREPPKQSTSSNPSKRHRERLNGELETVASLLPYDQTVITRLDKLSVLRLAVSYLQVKTHFQVCVQSQYAQHYPYSPYGAHFGQQYALIDRVHANETTVFKSLCGFVLILNENGEIYYASDNIETYLGFHQSDILHQPVFDMIHSEDRDDIRHQLRWNHNLPSTVHWNNLFTNDGQHYLERNASARFRCLLDNTCGFLRIDIRGRLALLNGLPPTFLATRPDQSHPVLGFVAVCSPFVPPPNLDGPDTEPFLKTKHALDMTLVSTDSKARQMLELDDSSLPLPFYSLIHPEDAAAMADAHGEVIKNGASGLLVYRMVSQRTQRCYWLQSSCRLFYKNGKPESVGCTHRLLTEVEGTVLLEKRASLSAKLFSFDDSLIQSPKLLQSTAALQTQPALAASSTFVDNLDVQNSTNNNTSNNHNNIIVNNTNTNNNNNSTSQKCQPTATGSSKQSSLKANKTNPTQSQINATKALGSTLGPNLHLSNLLAIGYNPAVMASGPAAASAAAPTTSYYADYLNTTGSACGSNQMPSMYDGALYAKYCSPAAYASPYSGMLEKYGDYPSGVTDSAAGFRCLIGGGANTYEDMMLGSTPCATQPKLYDEHWFATEPILEPSAVSGQSVMKHYGSYGLEQPTGTLWSTPKSAILSTAAAKLEPGQFSMAEVTNTLLG